MAEFIYHPTTAVTGPGARWYIERQPAGIQDPSVVRFFKASASRKLFSHLAKWSPSGWDPSWWVPTSREVPSWLLARTHRYMLEHALRAMEQADSSRQAG